MSNNLLKNIGFLAAVSLLTACRANALFENADQAYSQDVIKGTVFEQSISHIDDGVFSQQILTHQQILAGAATSDFEYQYCLRHFGKYYHNRYPEHDAEQITQALWQICQNQLLIYNVYSVLMAADAMDKPMSEYEAWGFVKKSEDRDGTMRQATKDFVQKFILNNKTNN